MALRTRAVQALTGWTVAFYTPDAILDIPGYTYVMDVFTSFELPPEWSTLNNILPDRVFPTYPSCHNADGEFLRRTPTPTVDSRAPSLNGSPMKIHATNGFDWRSYSPSIDPRELADTIHGVETPVPEPKRVVGIPPPSPSSVRGSWSKAVRRMAQKRFPNISRSESQLRRVSSRRERQWRSEVDGSFPRPQSPGDILALARLGRGSMDSPAPADVSGTRKVPLALPHEMRYYTYDRPNWVIRLRKEHISPRERIRTSMVLNMVFIQVCQDALNPAFARLKPNERKSILEIIGDRKNHDNAEYLNQVPLETKKNVVMTSLNFQLYFGRFFPVLSLASPSPANHIHWLVVAHHGVRLVFQQHRSADFDIQATLTLGEIISVQTMRVPCIPGWRLGDTSVNTQAGLTGTNRSTTNSGKNSNNMLVVTIADKVYRLYSDTADRICEMIQSFLNEYNEEMVRLKEAAERRLLRSALRGTVTPESPRPQSTPEVGFRYMRSPPLLANVFPQRDMFTPLPESSSPSLKSESPVVHKPPVSPKRLTSNSPTLSSQDSVVSRLPQTGLAISGQRRSSVSNPQDSHSDDHALSTCGGEHTNGSVRYKVDSPAHVEELEHDLQPPGLTQTKQHALLPFADQHFAQKVRTVDQLSWDPSSERFLALLHHTNSADVKTAQHTFSLILRFCGEEITSDPPYTVFRQLVETLWTHPQLSDEVYCQLVKQTYRNRSSLSNGNSAPWLLWALVSIFVPTTDELRAYLVRYVNDNSDSSKDNVLGAAKETLSRSMELVAKFGPRKLLPPDKVLKALTLLKRVR
ncbi:uncharacterized protein DEA37_0015045 [Paragonimus westermani]|uniref:MyTH4 domain-containing protein n=1 Tax=Paragonimus westermani TaxID=34504 RepID=A0A5J4NFU4_9TREM|nr:uncharacterized protein DEA37_0015045 [Paragonimus westermani]